VQLDRRPGGRDEVEDVRVLVAGTAAAVQLHLAVELLQREQRVQRAVAPRAGVCVVVVRLVLAERRLLCPACAVDLSS
jgi:hypothetical protein